MLQCALFLTRRGRALQIKALQIKALQKVDTLSSEDLQAVAVRRQDFLRKYPEFDFRAQGGAAASGHSFALALAREMAAEAVFSNPVRDISARKFLGPFIVCLKSLLRSLSRPFIKIIFSRQQKMNELQVALAYNVSALEERMLELENRMSGLPSEPER